MPKSHAMPAHRAFPLDWASVNSAAFSHGRPISWLWVVVIGADFFFLSNPVTLFTFDASLRISCGLTMTALVFTPRRHFPRPALSIVAMLGLGLVSSLWSWFSRLTIDFTAIYIVTAAIGIAIAVTVDARTLAMGALLGGCTIVTISLVGLWQGLPGVEIPPGAEGYLGGVGSNRNILAYSTVVPLALAVGGIPRARWERAVWLVGVAVLLLGVALAESGTGYLAAGAVLIAAIAMAFIDWWHPPEATLGARRTGVKIGAAAITAGCAIGLTPVIGSALGRDFDSLSGRVPLWEAIWKASTGSVRWFGDGWGAVWPHPWYQAPPNETYQRISASVPLSHGHNSALDLLPELGIVGIVVMATVYVQAVARGISLRRPSTASPSADRLAASRMTFLAVIALCIVGLTEPMSVIPMGWFSIAILASGISVPVPPDHSPSPNSVSTALWRSG